MFFLYLRLGIKHYYGAQYNSLNGSIAAEKKAEVTTVVEDSFVHKKHFIKQMPSRKLKQNSFSPLLEYDYSQGTVLP